MTSKVIQTITGNDVHYKVIKDGYKTITETIHITDDMSTRTTYDLSPSTVVHDPELDYTVDTSHEYPPVITFNENVVTPDNTEITTNKYIYAPYGKDYLIMDFEQQEDNFIRVGNVRVDTDGTVSGFSATNHLDVNTSYLNNANSWEIMFQIKTGSDISSTQNFFTYGDGGQGILGYMATGIFRIYANASATSHKWDVASNVQIIQAIANTDYWFKYEKKDNKFNVYYSLDGEDFTLSSTFNTIPTSLTTLHVGWRPDSFTNEYFRGSINLSKTYIKVGNEYGWEPTWNKLARNYNIVGTASVDNDIAYNFNSSSYLTPCFSPTTDTWEFTTKIYTGSQLTSHHNQILHNFTKNYAMAITRQGVSGTPMSSYINNTWTQGTTSLSANTEYWFRFSCVNKVCKLYITRYTSQTVCPPASSMTLQCTVTASASFIGDWISLSTNGDQYWGGEIDLKNTHFIEGDYTWNYEEVTGTNATVYGVCRINQNNEVKNLDSGGYLTVPNTLGVVGNTFYYHFKTDAITSASKRIYTLEGFDTTWVYGSNLRSYSYSGGSQFDIKTNLTANTDYWLRVKTLAGKREYAISEDGITYVNCITASDTSYGPTTNKFYFGCSHLNTEYWNGTIYMSDFRVLNSDGEEIYSGIKPVGEFVPGILDSSIDDEGDPITLNLYDVETNKRTLILNDDRDVNVSGKQFVQYDGEVDIPEHGLSLYDEDKHTWSKYRFATLSVDDADTRLYVEGNIA